jgi:hypothetical protein
VITIKKCEDEIIEIKIPISSSTQTTTTKTNAQTVDNWFSDPTYVSLLDFMVTDK